MASWKRIALRAEERVDELRKENEQLKKEHISYSKFKVNTLLHNKECWVYSDDLKLMEKIQAESEVMGLCSVIYERTEDGWI